MNLHARLHRFFASQRNGCQSPVLANLTGLYGASLNAGLLRHCEVAVAVTRLKRKWPREWVAVCMRWHFVLEEDAVEITARDAREKALQARRQRDAKQVKWMRKVENVAIKRAEELRCERVKWERLDQYTDGMALLAEWLGLTEAA